MRTYRYLIPVALVALLLVQVASVQHWFGWHGQAARTLGGPDVTGRWTIVYVETDCGAGCQAALGHLAGALDRLGPEASRVAAVLLTQDPAALRVDSRIARLAGTAAGIRQAEAGHNDPDAPPGTGLFVVRRPNGAFAGTIDGAANAQVIAGRLRDLIG